jgi:hypothetical protein
MSAARTLKHPKIFLMRQFSPQKLGKKNAAAHANAVP